MPMTVVSGDLFAPGGPAALAHGVNCQGFMGAGIAKQFRDTFHEMYREYQRLCADGDFHPGVCIPWQRNGRTVFNLATQDQPGPDARIEAVIESVRKMIDLAPSLGVERIGMPLVGSGIGGLFAHEVEYVLHLLAMANADVHLVVVRDFVKGQILTPIPAEKEPT